MSVNYITTVLTSIYFLLLALNNQNRHGHDYSQDNDIKTRRLLFHTTPIHDNPTFNALLHLKGEANYVEYPPPRSEVRSSLMSSSLILDTSFNAKQPRPPTQLAKDMGFRKQHNNSVDQNSSINHNNINVGESNGDSSITTVLDDRNKNARCRQEETTAVAKSAPLLANDPVSPPPICRVTSVDDCGESEYTENTEIEEDNDWASNFDHGETDSGVNIYVEPQCLENNLNLSPNIQNDVM